MAKINPYSLPRPKPVEDTRTFRDPDQPDVPITLTLRIQKGLAFKSRVQEKSAELQEKFMGPKAAMLPTHDNEPILPTVMVCDTVAAIVCCQSVENEADAYNFLEAFGLSSSHPTAFEEIHAWAIGLINRPAEEPEKDGGEEDQQPDFTATTSGPVSTTTKPTRK